MLSFPEFDPLTTASSSELTTAPLGREGINITPMADEKAGQWWSQCREELRGSPGQAPSAPRPVDHPHPVPHHAYLSLDFWRQQLGMMSVTGLAVWNKMPSTQPLILPVL